MTLLRLEPAEQLGALAEAQAAVAEAAHYLRSCGGVYSGRQAAKLEEAERQLEAVIGNLRIPLRGEP